jgi:hypothetical protein
MNEQLTSWLLLARRGGSWEKVEPMMVKDISSGNHLSDSDVRSWIQKTSVLGGGGLGDNTLGMKVQPQKRVPVGIQWDGGNGGEWLIRRWKLDPIEARAEFLSRVELPPKTKWELVYPAKLQPVVDDRLLKQAGFGGAASPRSPELWERRPTWIKSLIINSYVRERNWEGITALFLPSQRVRVLSEFYRMSRNVWIDWVKGELKPPAIKSVGTSDLWVGVKTREVGRPYLAWAFSGSKVTRDRITRAWYWTNLAVRKLVPTSVVLG